MALSKITYTDKETLNPLPSVADKNKVTDDDMNEIKSVVNSAIDQVEANTIPQQATAPADPSENDLWIDTDEPGVINIDSTPSTSSTNPIENQAITNFVKGEVLYYDADGTTDDIVLNDSAANYLTIEVFYQYGDTSSYTDGFTSMTSSKIYSPNGKNINLSMILASSGGGNMQIFSSVYKISGTSFAITNWYGRGQINNNAATNTEKTKAIKVVRIVGYK